MAGRAGNEIAIGAAVHLTTGNGNCLWVPPAFGFLPMCVCV